MTTKTIEKPKTVFRGDLQTIADELTAQGWKFERIANLNVWDGTKIIDGLPFSYRHKSAEQVFKVCKEKDDFQKAKEYLIKNYFHTYEIQDILKFPEKQAVEYLYERAKEDHRGYASTGIRVSTKTGGKVEVTVNKSKPITFNIKEIAAEVIARKSSNKSTKSVKSSAVGKTKSSPEENRRKTFEDLGWTLSDRGNGTFSANKKFPHNQFTSRLDGAKSWDELLNAVQDVEVKEKLQNAETTEGQVIAYEVDLGKIVPSDFEPQVHRRSHFKDADLDELAASIKADGLLSPITVRPRFDETFQIVCGERRWIATKRAGLTKIACFIKDVSDKTAFDIQSNENLQRKEPDPLDTAVTYQYYIDHFKMTVDDLAVQFNKEKSVITKALKLNDLIPSAVEDYYNGYLPIGHAAVICKQSPKDQMYILKELTYHENDKTIGAYPLADLKLNIRDEITLKLATAPFDKEDTRLHLKQLTCSDCPERTGFKPLLFAEDFGGEDRCLNKSCFELKTSTYRKLQLLDVAETLPNPENKPIEEIAKDIPLVTDKPFVHDKSLKDKVLTNQELLPEKECEFSVLRIAAEGERKNQKVWICQNETCEIHHPQPKPDELTESQKISRKRDLYIRVGNEMRLKIFAAAMLTFDDYTPIWQFDDLIRELLVNVLIRSIDFSAQLTALTKSWKIPFKFDSRSNIEKFVNALDKAQISRMFFLLAKVNELKAQYAESPLRIETIKKLTADYTNYEYEVLEAEMIAKFAPYQFKEEAEQYLSAVRHGAVPPKKPTFWTELPEDANR